MSKELEKNKEQKVAWQKVADELQEMFKLDINTLILEKIIAIQVRIRHVSRVKVLIGR